MLLDEKEDKIFNPRERELIIAYLTYALEDIRSLSEIGSHFLQMAIASLSDEAALDNPIEPVRPTPTH